MREQIKETNYLHPRLRHWLVQQCPVSLNLEKRKKGKISQFHAICLVAGIAQHAVVKTAR